MARMTCFHGILKRDLFKRITFLSTFLSAEDVLDPAAANANLKRLSLWRRQCYSWLSLTKPQPLINCEGTVRK